jgi:hypothetical protein
VNDRGVRQVFIPVMWKIPVPHWLHIFLWLLANNKVLTRDNLAKRRHLDDKSCLFCNEPETNAHLFFGCCVAQVMWGIIAELFTLGRVKDFESFGKMWLRGKSFKAYNVCIQLLYGLCGRQEITCAFRAWPGPKWKL